MTRRVRLTIEGDEDKLDSFRRYCSDLTLYYGYTAHSANAINAAWDTRQPVARPLKVGDVVMNTHINEGRIVEAIGKDWVITRTDAGAVRLWIDEHRFRLRLFGHLSPPIDWEASE